MNAAYAKLAEYFGTIGIASIVAWLVAAALCAVFILGWRRSKVCWAALAVAIAAVVLANVNSSYVSAIKIDWSEALEAAKARAAVEENGSAPAYRRQGKARRAEGMKAEEKVPIGPDTAGQPIEPNVRKMPMHDVAEANRLDRLNLLFARCTLALAVLLVVVDYFRRFNKTFESYLPLPLGGRLVDSLFAKSHVEHVPRDKAPRWKPFLEQSVRKGETFIYFGREDFLAGVVVETAAVVRAGALAVGEKVVCTDADGRLDDEFLFESAWFNRYCFVHVGGDLRVLDRLDALAEFLELRHETRASAAHTVNVVWDLERPIPSGTLERLLPLCREANFRLVLPTAAM